MASALNIQMTSIDVHGGYTVEDLQRDLEDPLQEASRNPKCTYLVFLDEINTSPEIGAFKEVVCDHSLKGKVFPGNVVVVAALNPYRTRPKIPSNGPRNKLEDKNVSKHYLTELDKEMSDLVYQVFPLPKSLEIYVWNFGSLSEVDEQQYITVMTKNMWSKPEFLDSVSFYSRVADKKKKTDAESLLKNLQQCFIHLISESQKFLRKKLKDRSVCSLRDVRRVNTLFVWFFNNREDKGTSYGVVEAIMLSLAHCYYYRLNQEHRQQYDTLITEDLKSGPGRIVNDSLINVIAKEHQRCAYHFLFHYQTKQFKLKKKKKKNK
ncbi:hypothetical protein RFI_20391 [Reticulomyxa filosa]|uniref:ATPase AAA-type core domain-containing protein n=1 Tax=Reticulomyxa filosa TaxID=46433 RepID=X6MV33_RETFI|nr:hypothetical protein RFI_20391 [Reticulomyxa filosa]|eukprot:ETO16945.1 hypothetical protein RFI_20391 [Reticulomyxa filosa]